jgi:hypothetical protein
LLPIHTRQIKRHIRVFKFVSLTFVLAISGCVIGNKEVDQPGPGAIQGNYESAISPQMQVCATWATGLSGATQRLCEPLSTAGVNPTNPSQTNMDPILKYFMSDPVYLQYNSSTGTFQLLPTGVSPTPTQGLPVQSDGQGDLQGGAEFSLGPLMSSFPNCSYFISYAAQGTYSSSGPYTTGTTLPLSGRIGMTVWWSYVQAQGSDCSEVLNCYNSAAACNAQDQANVQAFFYPFIKSGALSTTNLTNLTELEYIVSYQ